MQVLRGYCGGGFNVQKPGLGGGSFIGFEVDVGGPESVTEFVKTEPIKLLHCQAHGGYLNQETVALE